MFFISFHFYPFSPFFCEGEPHALPAQAFRIFYHSFFYDSEPINMLRALDRGRAEREPRISIPVPAVPVSELLAGKEPENK